MSDIASAFPAIEPIVRGIVIGGTYALTAMGMTLIFGVLGIINVAHGDFLMLGAYATYFLWAEAGLNPVLGIVLLIPLGLALGAILQRSVFERIVARPEISSLLVTFALSTILWNSAQLAFSADFRSINYLTDAVSIGGVWVSRSSLLAFGLSLCLAGAVFLFLHKSDWGRAIRGTTQNDPLARACGIDVVKVRTLCLGLGIALAATSGGLVAMSSAIYPQMGNIYLGKAFAVAVLGGMGSVAGALAGGMLLGVIEAFVAHYGSTQAAELVSYGLIFGLLIARPTGLFGSDAS